MTLTEKMLRYRAKHRISQSELAELCGVSLQTIYTIETGQQTPKKTTELQILMVVEGEADESEHKQD